MMMEGRNLTLQIVDWQTDMKAKQDCQMADETAAAASRGINPEHYKRTANYQPAGGARSANRGLAEWRARSAMIMGRAEKSYKRALCIVADKHGIDDVPNPDVELEVKYAPLEYPEDPAAQVDVDVKRVGLGLDSQVTLIQREHPEWSEEDAREALEKRMDDIAWVAEQKATRNVPNDVTNESRTAEQNGETGPAVRDGQPQPGATPPGQAQMTAPVER
jgi:hypothetical protein